MTSLNQYSKWDHLQVSSDEEDNKDIDHNPGMLSVAPVPLAHLCARHGYIMCALCLPRLLV